MHQLVVVWCDTVPLLLKQMWHLMTFSPVSDIWKPRFPACTEISFFSLCQATVKITLKSKHRQTLYLYLGIVDVCTSTFLMGCWDRLLFFGQFALCLRIYCQNVSVQYREQLPHFSILLNPSSHLDRGHQFMLYTYLCNSSLKCNCGKQNQCISKETASCLWSVSVNR